MNVLRLITLLAIAAKVVSRDAGKADSICQNDSDCQLFYECEGHEIKRCVHKTLFPNPSARELVGVFLCFIVNALTNSAGVGAGALVAPFLMLFNNFSPNEAVVVSYPIILGGGLGTAIYLIHRRNSETKMPLVNYNNLILVVPAIQVGAPIGVLLNRLLVPVVINILLIAMLGFIAFGMAMKCCLLYRREKNKRKQVQQKNHLNKQNLPQTNNIEATTADQNVQITYDVTSKIIEKIKETNNIQQQELKIEQMEANDLIIEQNGAQIQNKIYCHKCGSRGNSQSEFTHTDLDKIPSSDSEATKAQRFGRRILLEEDKKAEGQEKAEDQGKFNNYAEKVENITQTNFELTTINTKIEKLWKKERRLFPPEKILLLVFFLMITTLLNLFFGTKKVKSIIGVQFCSAAYWSIFSALIVIQSMFFGCSSWLVLKWRREKMEIGWDLTQEMKINKKRLVLFFIFGVLGGLFSGLLAAGGALIMWFLFLEFGVPPLMLLPTTSLLLVTTNFTTVLMSCLEDNYSGADLAFYLCSAALFSFIAMQMVHYIVRKTRRQSFILANLAIILCLAFVINLAVLFVELKSNHDFMLEFKSLC